MNLGNSLFQARKKMWTFAGRGSRKTGRKQADGLKVGNR